MFGALLWASGPTLGSGDGGYVVERPHYAMGLGALLLAFAVVYFGLERSGRAPRRWLGLAHFVATFAGVLLVFAPVFVLTLTGPPRGVEALPDLFDGWARLSLAGYGLILAGQVLFVAVLIDAFRRKPIPG